MSLAALTAPELIFHDLSCRDRSTALRALAQRIVRTGRFEDAEELYRRLWEREKQGSTGIGAGVAVPHCKMSGLEQVILAVGLAPQGIEFGAIDDHPVKLFFLVVSPEDQPVAHLQCLAAVSKWIKANEHVDKLLRLEDPSSIFDLLKEGEGRDG